MSWAELTTVFFMGTVKFMIAPLTGAGLGLPFVQTMIASVLGAWLSATIFYFLSDFFITRAREKRLKKAIETGEVKSVGKKKRVLNRMIIKIKNSIGQVGICFLAPLFLSVPIGTIICAKFYYKKRFTFPIIIISLFINSILLTSLYYLFF